MENRYSYSRVARWLRCGHAYHLEYERDLVPVVDNVSLRRGTLIHLGLETGILTKDYGAAADAIRKKFDIWKSNSRVKLLWEESPEFWDESVTMRDDCIKITHRVLERHGIISGRWETVCLSGHPLVEYDMHYDAGAWKFSGKLDWVAKDLNTGHTWLIDFKTRKQMQPVEVDETNTQMGIYQHLLSTYGLEINGSCVWQIRAAVPRAPKLNKNGTMSRSVIATDWETYKETLSENGIAPHTYSDMKDKLSDFERLGFTYRTAREAKAMWAEAARILHEMQEETLPNYRHMNPFNCRNCAYRDHCMETLRGNDVTEIEKAFFTKKENRDDTNQASV